MKQRIPALRVLFGVLSVATAMAQTPPAPAVLAPAAEGVIELSPFTVNSSADKGFRAENTLSGSRLNTPLRDTAAPISVFTEAFLEGRASR